VSKLVKIAFHDPDVTVARFGYERYAVVDGEAEASPAAAKHFVAAGLAAATIDGGATYVTGTWDDAEPDWQPVEPDEGDEEVAEEDDE
jgi:hypothetical protein